jgi:hypothetical protein
LTERAALEIIEENAHLPLSFLDALPMAFTGSSQLRV